MKWLIFGEFMQPDTLEELVVNFALFDDWEGRYAYLIDLGKALSPMEEALKTQASLVRGCTSRVWMVAEEKDGRFYFTADSDAHIVRGLIAILLLAYQGKTAQDIMAVDIEAAFAHMGLDQHLSPSRRNGFFSMVERIKTLASS